MILQENGFHNPAAIFAAAQRTVLQELPPCRYEGSGAEGACGISPAGIRRRRPSLAGNILTE
jgi:hypothetical protein